ncbi:uncharacterized protein HMPREF1541_06865 [Cyphellophora europaea CBS 101466]|uniref:G-patch domain-containing protein n=1 Tax=Cyphellophora europaea (strain CBS 101466) TaxID=1220924 RepID=W2RQN4_CYPE1|nr:uncharacterized protein HMPREF1541_06865 [Cyphellophora europaea CBS 101466]ETN38826.1 hypothetical protein HMPREF1541_06865 [Cyphellophora europaea CBS 101466]
MGLAAPRQRRRIAADPRNLTWSNNASGTSFGHKIMTSQGWAEGQSLGSKSSVHHAAHARDENAARLAAARVGVVFKDDTLGLGAKLKSKDVEGQRTGMDAFMGLLGRLNAKGEKEVEAVERKQEEKKLERYALGRWGGMVFVPGGVLVGGDEYSGKKQAREAEEKKRRAEEAEGSADAGEGGETSEDRARRRDEKKKRKEERRARREAKAARRAEKAAKKSQTTLQATSADEEEASRSTSRSTSVSKRRSKPAPDEPVSSASSDSEEVTAKAVKKSKKRQHSETSTPVLSDTTPAPFPRPTVRSGRQILRGRNIEAKRRAFQDAKGLDGIFMRAAG